MHADVQQRESTSKSCFLFLFVMNVPQGTGAITMNTAIDKSFASTMFRIDQYLRRSAIPRIVA